MKLNNVIIKPVISEKSLKEAQVGKYTFLVAKNADKNDIKNAIKEIFNVDVEKVYTNIVKGGKIKITKFGKKRAKVEYKKARALLKKGQKLDIFEEVNK